MAILQHVKAAGCSGGSVTRGMAGFGAHSQIKTANILRLSMDLPVVITVIDLPERIATFTSETMRLFESGTALFAATNIIVSVVAGVVAALLGLATGRGL